MSIVEAIIAEGIRVYVEGYLDGYGAVEDTPRERAHLAEDIAENMAEVLMERLRDTGHTIVPSVEPTPDPDCGQVWLAGARSDGFHLITEPGLIWDFGGNEYTVDEARSYAAAMLSAAAAASPTAQTQEVDR